MMNSGLYQLRNWVPFYQPLLNFWGVGLTRQLFYFDSNSKHKAELCSAVEATVFGSSFKTAFSFWVEAKTQSTWLNVGQSPASHILQSLRPCSYVHSFWNGVFKQYNFCMDCCLVDRFHSAAFFPGDRCYPTPCCMTTERLADAWCTFYLGNMLSSKWSK